MTPPVCKDDHTSADVYALIPTRLGVTIAAVGDIAARIDDGETFEEAATNAGIDSSWNAADLVRQTERVRRLNLTGDSKAFWADEP